MTRTPPFALAPVFVAACVAAAGCATSARAEPPPPEVSPAPPSPDGSAEGGAARPSPTTAADAAADAGRTVPYPIPDWTTGVPEQQGMSTAALDAAAAIAEARQSHCLLVIRHGVLVYERYWNGRDRSSKDPSWSIAKSYASALVGIAIDRGDLASLDQSVAELVPEWRGTDREAITLRHLVSMTSGLKWDVFEDYVSLATLATDGTTFAIDRPLAAPPGTRWTYDNGTVQVLERVFRAATGRTIEEYAHLHLWSPIGADASWKHDPSGNPTAYANVLASCRDHARLGYLYLHGGTWGTEQVVSAAHVAATRTPSQDMNRAYGFLFWLNADTPAVDAMGTAWKGLMVPFAPKDLFAARGFGNQFVDVLPGLDLVVVRFGQDPLGKFDPATLAVDARFETHDAILEPILAAIADKP